MSSRFSSIHDDRQNVFELQSMLREIGKFTEGIDLINPDGLFLTETTKAIRDIQTFLGLNPTGEVDLETWNGILERFRHNQA